MNDHELANFLAVEAGKKLLDYRENSVHRVGDKEFAASADKISHKFIGSKLQELRPNDHFLSEEGVDQSNRLSSERVWIVDPLDGSKEYALGQNDFAVHIALWEKSSSTPFKITAASVFVPALNLLHNLKSGMSRSQHLDSVRIIVSATRPPKEIDRILKILNNKFPLIYPPTVVKMGSVGAKVSKILFDEADVYLNFEGFYEWDLAAPASVAVSSGLIACHISGTPFNFNNSNLFVNNAIIGKKEIADVLIKSLA